MDKKITILAVTKLGNELCVAGVDSDGNWIRPTTLSRGGWRQFYKVDIYDKNRKPIITLSNVVVIHLVRPIPEIDTPHIEDWEYGRRSKPVFIRTLSDSQRLSLFQEISEQTLAPLIKNHERSLCLIEPSSIVSVNFANISYTGKYQPILDFTFKGKSYSYKVTDIYWRALGRNLLAKGHNPVLKGKELQSILQYSKFFLTIGLGRQFKEKYWPFIVGIHTVPQFQVKIDYGNI
ncbi:MAG: hypothetical protein KJ706_02905 [Candidatus Omnitrophica bacterium]|nr:hypothetical protein [Candidatus Omnitrophota bacterium]